MDLLLGVLDAAPGGALGPRSTSSALVERTRAAGLPVTLTVTGTRQHLPAGAELAVYRVVQESLTNAIKHAGGAATQVALTWGDDARGRRGRLR
jgi:signal transduction histidine kinase